MVKLIVEIFLPLGSHMFLVFLELKIITEFGRMASLLAWTSNGYENCATFTE